MTPSTTPRTRLCHFCGKPLPEPSHSHVTYVKLLIDEVVPCCLSCMGCRRYKPVMLENAATGHRQAAEERKPTIRLKTGKRGTR